MASNRIYIQIDFGTAAANQAITGINQNIKQLGQATGQATKQAAQGVDSMTLSIQQTSRAFDQLASAFAGLGLARVGVSMIQAGDDINRVQIALTAMTGSAKKAAVELANIRDIARKGPFAFQDLAEGAQRLQAFGFEAERIPGVINSIANAAAALGGGKQKIDSLILAIGQIRVKGVAQGQELFRQLAEQGVDVFPIIKEKLKSQTGRDYSVTDIRKLVEKGRLDGESIAQAILDGLNRRFASLGTDSLALLTSQFQKLVDDAKDLARVLTNELTPALTQVVGWARAAVIEFKSWPPIIQELVVGLGALVSAIAVLPAALTVIKALSSGFVLAATGVTAFLAILRPFQIAMGLAFSVRSITAFFAVLGPEMAALKLMLIGVSEIVIPLAAALAALAIGYKTGSAIREYFTGDNAKQTALDEANKSTAIFQANQLRNRLQKTPEYWKQYQGYPSTPYEKQSMDDLQGQIRDMQSKLQSLKSERDARAKQALIDDAELRKHQEEIAQQALEHAQQRDVGGIAALKYKYAGLLRQEEGEPGKDQAYQAGIEKVRRAQAIDTEKEIRAYQDKTRDARLRADKAANQEYLAEVERNSQYRIGLVATETQETVLLQAKAAQQVLEIQNTAAERGRTARLLDAEADHNEAIRKLTEDIKLHEYPQKIVNERLKVIDDDYLRAKKQANAQADDAIAQHTLEVQRKVAEDTTDILRQTREAEQEYRVNELGRQSDLAKARLDTGLAQTEQQKVDLVRATEAIEIDSARKVYEARDQFIQTEFKDRLAAIDLLHDIGLIKEEQYQQANAALVKYYGDKSADLAAQWVHDEETLRLAAVKRENELAIAERKKAFDSFKDAAGKVFDALVSKSQSVWAAIGNAFKTAILGAIKEIVTSRAAAALMSLFGYGQVAFTGGPRGYGGAPVFASGPFTGGAASGGGLLGALGGFLGLGQGAQPVATGGGGGGGTATVTTSGPGAPTTGGANRYKDSRYYAAVGGLQDPGLPGTGLVPVNLPSLAQLGIPGLTGAPGYQVPSQMAKLRDAFNIGKPIQQVGVGRTPIPWAQATPGQRLGSIISSQGFHALAATVGFTAAMAGLQRGGVLGNTLTVGGAALAGYGLAPMLGMSGPQGVIAGAGAGLFAAGIQRGGVSGAAMSTVGGALTGAVIGSMIAPGIGTVVGAAVGAGIGLTAGIVRMFVKTADEKLRALLKQVYGIDVSDANVRKQILELAKTKYGGNLELTVRSQEVQDMVRLYSMATGANATLPRPMYGVTFAQSGAGGAQLQPVYSNGQMVTSPYTGVTTQQWNTASMFFQINPAMANALFEGRVVQVVGNNPTVVGDANAQSARAGATRNAQRSAFLEPSTVMR